MSSLKAYVASRGLTLGRLRSRSCRSHQRLPTTCGRNVLSMGAHGPSRAPLMSRDVLSDSPSTAQRSGFDSRRLHSEALVFQGFCSFRTLGPTTRVHQPPAFGERCGRFQVATAKRCRAAHRAKSGVNRSRLSTLGSCPTIQTAPTSTTEGRTSRMISWPSAASTSPISASRSVVTTARPHGRGHGRQSGPSTVTPFTSTYKWSATRVTTTSSRRSSIVASLVSKAPSTAARSTPEVARARCASRASST